MRRICRVGAAAAGVLAVAVLGTGCGGSDGDGASGAPVVVSETPDAEVTDLGDWFPTDDPLATDDTTEDYETVDPAVSGPEAEIDQMATEKNWETFSGSSAGSWVTQVCSDLESSPEEHGQSPAQWLDDGIRMEEDGKDILLFGIPKACPKWTSAVKAAASGKYERWFGDGTFVVTSKKLDGEQTIPPGTYRAEGRMENCYWERTSESGDIIDNNFATSARKITVTISSSDGQFTSEGCATWKPVK
ncbi:hypothetical protein ACFTZM_10915 [Streptomyces hydrogenans]|uniref:hypothetical protein n=1 Tax=Streptomyces hydrogenans TaxID=1873719 RepID=UPI00362FE50F